MIDEVCDDNDDVLGVVLEGIDDPMDEYLDEITVAIGVRLGLSDEQAEVLRERLSWKLVLLPS